MGAIPHCQRRGHLGCDRTLDLRPDLVATPISDTSLERTVSLAVPIGREDTEVVQNFLKAAVGFDWPNA